MNLLYLPLWFFKTRLLGKKIPLQTVLFITEQCNLTCRHCLVYKKEKPIIKSYQQIKEELEYSYGLGSRFVDLEGGEPTLWKEGSYDLNSLIRLAKQIGFFSVTVTTNAILPFQGCEADSIWVSLDGVGDFHDDIRGKGSFERLQRNIEAAKHPALSVNMVINSRNYTSVTETIEYARNNPHIKSISLNFHTPYEGASDLFLDWPLRSTVIDEIIRMKKAGYPVMNSISGLKLMKNNRFKKHCWVTNFIMPDSTRYDACQGLYANVCDQCGFSMAGEMNSVFRLKPDTILAGMKLRM